ncbi:hypothetical protein QTJ16_003389 [Diplocarpon rosae]|uniref:RNase III domain-containing protein n=1 Tax=Diplocarpon rosae TaxID=946125 RepID=A0AAD9WEL7_9HELO|nr:hypothetical protein QTJ16_003389 [Diplocarpon rosae]
MASIREKLQQLEAIIGHQFHNADLGIASLCAAGALEAATTDGNKLLAMTGDNLLRLILVDEMSDRGFTRGQIQAVINRLSANEYLGDLCRRIGVEALIIKNNSQRNDRPSLITVSAAIEAILAAVWKDTGKDLGAVVNVIARIGLWPEP